MGTPSTARTPAPASRAPSRGQRGSVIRSSVRTYSASTKESTHGPSTSSSCARSSACAVGSDPSTYRSEPPSSTSISPTPLTAKSPRAALDGALAALRSHAA